MKNVSTSLWTRLADIAGLVATPLVPSHYIALVSPLAATHTRQARVEAVWDETADTRTLTLRPGRGWQPHRAGQHVRIGLAIDGRIATRTYSISSPPERRDGCITITIKAQGKMSRALVRDLAVGSYVTIGLPEGEFVLPYVLPAQLAFITAGSGITPVMSMLRSLAARGELPDIAHVHYARHDRDVIFGDELRALAAAHPRYRLTIVHTHDDPRRFSRERLADLVPDWRARETWACGPQGLLAAITDCYTGGPALHIERFTAAFAPAPADATDGTVHFTTTQRKTKSDGRTPLLRIAEDAGVYAPHGCRMGICHTCDTTLLAGCVRDLRTGERIDQPGTRIQVCVCAAAGDVELAL
ncbi:MAG TPA: ferredoxin reductase [Kofleriaceae bacterium]|nr:ferredoxin reductase [Kofleriaceae bacterium]